MMMFSASLLLVILISIGSCTCTREPLAYMPTRGRSITWREINWIVEQIDSGRWGNNIQVLPANLKEAHDTANKLYLNKQVEDKYGINEFKGKSDYWLSSTIWDFERLSDEEVGTSSHCVSIDAISLIEVMDMKFGGIKRIEQSNLKPSKSLTLDYLRYFAPKLFSRCLGRLENDYNIYLTRLKPDTEAKLDALISMGEQYPPEEAEVRLTIQAENLDLLKGKFNAEKMLIAVRQYIGEVEKQSWLKSESARTLTRFIEGVCRDFRNQLACTFDVYNMARFLVPEKAAELKLTTKFRKLNEYSRICGPLQWETRREVQSNIKSNMVRIGISSALGFN